MLTIVSSLCPFSSLMFWLLSLPSGYAFVVAVIDSKGQQRAVYRKSHLYDVDAGPSGKFHESATTAPGQRMGAVVHGTPIGSVGLTTCYDLRFPYVYSALRAAGADVVLVPSAFMPSTGAAHWHTLLRARAIETQVYIGAAAQVGVHNGGRGSYGHALLVVLE